MKTTKKLLSILLALVLVFGLMPATVLADNEQEEYVYLSVSYDSEYIDDQDGNPIAYFPVSLDDIKNIDLAEYGLENMLFDKDGDGNYETTALQLLIYAHEELYGGVWSDVYFSAYPGSSYFEDGIFGFTENLVYFHNGDFPVDETQSSDYYTVGATSDRIVLEPGDFIDIASFGCYAFIWDTQGGFHLFADQDGNYVHDYTAEKGNPLSVKLLHSFCDLMYGESWIKEATDYEVYYGSVFGEAEGSVTTDESGSAEITFDEAGTYYVWCEGGNGADDGTHGGCDYCRETGEPCIVSSPAYAKVTVTGDNTPTEPNPDEPNPDNPTPDNPDPDDPTPDDTEEPGVALNVKEVLNATMAKLASTVTAPSFGTNAGEWTVFGLARGGYYEKGSKYFEEYYERIVETVNTEAAKVDMNGALHKSKSTENSRLIVALSAIGKNATSVGNWDLVEAYSANGINWIKKQGLNGTIWALIALDSNNYETSDADIRQQCVQAILNAQHDDGGWSLITNKTYTSNVDITGMALTALAPYKDQTEVKAACNKAISWLSESQLENGGFPYGEGETSESCVWAIVALTEWGINPATDSRFVKNGKSAVDNLLSYYSEDENMFAHQGSASNAMATDQACYALVAYDRFVNGKTSLFDYSDVTFEGIIHNATEENKNAFTGSLEPPVNELEDMLLTDAEKEKVAKGKDVKINLSVEDISKTVTDNDKALVEKALGKNTVGLYLNIELYKQIGNDAPVNITETKGKVTISVILPENLRNTDSKVERTYKVIRVHEGKTDILDAEYDAKTGKLTFKTDAFSTYAVVYTDTAVAAKENPKTSDNFNIILISAVMLASATAAAAVISFRKKLVK